jgi:hypothetical protein
MRPNQILRLDNFDSWLQDKFDHPIPNTRLAVEELTTGKVTTFKEIPNPFLPYHGRDEYGNLLYLEDGTPDMWQKIETGGERSLYLTEVRDQNKQKDSLSDHRLTEWGHLYSSIGRVVNDRLSAAKEDDVERCRSDMHNVVALKAVLQDVCVGQAKDSLEDYKYALEHMRYVKGTSFDDFVGRFNRGHRRVRTAGGHYDDCDLTTHFRNALDKEAWKHLLPDLWAMKKSDYSYPTYAWTIARIQEDLLSDKRAAGHLNKKKSSGSAGEDSGSDASDDRSSDGKKRRHSRKNNRSRKKASTSEDQPSEVKVLQAKHDKVVKELASYKKGKPAPPARAATPAHVSLLWCSR